MGTTTNGPAALTKKDIASFRSLIKKSREEIISRENEDEKKRPEDELEKSSGQEEQTKETTSPIKEEDQKFVKHFFQRKPAGRPKKDPKEKAKRVEVYLDPKTVDLLDHLPFGRGRGTTIKIIIDEYQKLKKREKEQVQKIRSLLKSLGRQFKEFDSIRYDQDKSEAIRVKYGEIAKIASTIYDFYSYFEFESLEAISEYLSEKEKGLLEYVINFKFNGMGVQKA